MKQIKDIKFVVAPGEVPTKEQLQTVLNAYVAGEYKPMGKLGDANEQSIPTTAA